MGSQEEALFHPGPLIEKPPSKGWRLIRCLRFSKASKSGGVSDQRQFLSRQLAVIKKAKAEAKA